jgi:large subunit ribosomal protein L25
MEEIVLHAEKRDVVGKQVRALRRQGKLPAVIYGHGIEPLVISLNQKEASRILPTLSTSHLVVINVDKLPHTTLVREKQRHPVKGHLIHVDFQEVSMTERLRAQVQLVFVGDAPAVKNYNGIIVVNMEELEVEALPGDLPDRITIDIGTLQNIGDAFHVRDIQLPSTVEMIDDLSEIIVVVTAPTMAVEEIAEAVTEEPEVIERGKKEEEDF